MQTANWIGKSGRKYDFELYPRGTEFKSIGGVYVLCNLISARQLRALYVGETKSFHDRLNACAFTHDGFKRAARIGFTHITVLRCADDALRLAIETDLRHALNPVCNRESIPTRV